MHFIEDVRSWLGWCPDGQVISPCKSPGLDPVYDTGMAIPDANGGPRDTGLFGVPLDMLGMLYAPVKTFRNSKNIPLSRIISWYALLIVLNSLFWSVVAYYVISSLPAREQLPGSLFWLTALYFFVLIIQTILIIGISSCVLYGLGRVLGGHSGLSMTVHAIIYGTTPILLLFGMGTELQFLMSTIIGISRGITISEVLLPGVFFLWAIILTSLGLQELQGLSIQRALFTVVMSAIVFILLLTWLLFTNPYHIFTFSTGGY